MTCERLLSHFPKRPKALCTASPPFRVAGKAFAWESPHEHGALALRCDIDERPLIVETRPAMFFMTPHYEAHPIVLVRLEGADAEELAGRIEDSWLLTAPTRLANAYAGD